MEERIGFPLEPIHCHFFPLVANPMGIVAVKAGTPIDGQDFFDQLFWSWCVDNPLIAEADIAIGTGVGHQEWENPILNSFWVRICAINPKITKHYAKINFGISYAKCHPWKGEEIGSFCTVCWLMTDGSFLRRGYSDNKEVIAPLLRIPDAHFAITRRRPGVASFPMINNVHLFTIGLRSSETLWRIG